MTAVPSLPDSAEEVSNVAEQSMASHMTIQSKADPFSARVRLHNIGHTGVVLYPFAAMFRYFSGRSPGPGPLICLSRQFPPDKGLPLSRDNSVSRSEYSKI